MRGAAGALVVQGALLWVLIAGLAVTGGKIARDPIAIFALAPDRPPPPIQPPPKRSKGKEGAASPANIRSTATDLVAPKPVLPAPPQPMPAAPIANLGAQATQGAAPVAGTGYGAGGSGNGLGSGGDGDGDGGGDTPPRRTGGRISPGDLPDDLVFLLQAGRDYVVGVKYAVEEDGRVDECRVTRASGNAQLDRLTCDLIERKFRYRPARDSDGDAFKSYIVESHTWNFEDAGPRRR